jgi:hypothetical protein
MGEMRNIYKILVGEPQRKRLLEVLGVDWSVILEWILKRVLIG